jgi:hypothetical protein
MVGTVRWVARSTFLLFGLVIIQTETQWQIYVKFSYFFSHGKSFVVILILAGDGRDNRSSILHSFLVQRGYSSRFAFGPKGRILLGCPPG